MADYDSGLPIRSEADGADERVHVKLVDHTTPAQGATIDTDGDLHIEMHGNKVTDQSDLVMELSEEGKVMTRGHYDVTDCSEPASLGLIVSQRSGTPGYTTMTLRPTAVSGEANSMCLDIALHDELGNYYDADNPLPVTLEENEGDEIHDFDKAVAIVKDASSNHTYSVANGKTLLLYGVLASASGKMKVELSIGDGEVAEAFVDKAVNFNSTAKPECSIELQRVPIKIVGTVNTTTIKVVKTNLDNQAQDLYSTFIGVERNT